VLKFLHPEAIPWPGTPFYNLISSTHVFQRHYELVARDILNHCSEGLLLDIGTGPGWLLLKLHKQSSGIRLVGMDSSTSMVAKARKNVSHAGLADIVQIREGNAIDMPFAEDSFDIVVSTGSMHHWKSPISALNDVYRVLKPQGYALIYDLVSDTPASVLDKMSREFGKLKLKLFWLHVFEEPFYSRENFEALARSSLFIKAQSRFVGLFCCLTLKKTPGK